MRCLWPPFGGFLRADGATPTPYFIVFLPVTQPLGLSIGSPRPASVSLGRGPWNLAPVDVQVIVPLPSPLRLGLCLFFSSPALICFSCLFLPYPFAQRLRGDPVSLAWENSCS